MLAALGHLQQLHLAQIQTGRAQYEAGTVGIESIGKSLREHHIDYIVGSLNVYHAVDPGIPQRLPFLVTVILIVKAYGHILLQTPGSEQISPLQLVGAGVGRSDADAVAGVEVGILACEFRAHIQLKQLPVGEVLGLVPKGDHIVSGVRLDRLGLLRHGDAFHTVALSLHLGQHKTVALHHDFGVHLTEHGKYIGIGVDSVCIGTGLDAGHIVAHPVVARLEVGADFKIRVIIARLLHCENQLVRLLESISAHRDIKT